MEKNLTEEQVKTILQNAPKGTDPNKIVDGLVSRGYILQGLNDKQPEQKKTDVFGTAKAALGGIASGVGGAALTAEDYLARKAVNAFGTDQMKANLNAAPSLQEKLKTQFGGNEHPTAYGVGQLGGEVVGLAAPVGAVGTLAKTGAKALGAGTKVATLTKAGAEGAAFTAGQGLTENKSQSLSDYAINTGLNIALPGAGIVAKGIGESMPGRIINSLIKPLQKDFAYGKNPGETIAKLGITGNTMEDLIQNIKVAKQEAGNTIGQVISQAKSPLQLSKEDTLKFLDEAISAANRTPRTNATLLSRLDAVKADIVDNLNSTGGTMQSAQDIKGMIGDLTKWTGAHSDDAVVNKALQKTYTSVRDQMDNGLKNELTPEQFTAYKQASDNYGNLMSAENAATHRDAIVSRGDLISFGAKNSALLAGIGSAIATGGGSIPVVLAGLAGAGIDKAMASPAFKTRLAQLLSKLAPNEVGTFFDKIPTAKSLFTEQELKNYIGDFKDVKANRGMIELNPKNWFEEVGNSADVGLKAKTKDLQLEMAQEAARTMRNNGVSVEVPTSKNAVQILKQAKEVARKKKVSDVVKDVMPSDKMKPFLEPKKKVVSSLEQEAKKYKSAEEFVKAKTNAYHGTDKVFEKFDLSKVGTTQKLDKYGMFFTSDKQTARNYSSLYPQKSKVNWTPQDKINAEKAIVMDAFIKDSDALTFSEVIDLYEKGKIKTKVKSEGFVRPSTYFDMNRDSIKEAMEVTGKDVFKITKEGETFYMVNNPDKMMSKSQLTDIWNKANKK